MAGRPLPVDPARLRRQFPALTDDDISAFEEVTARILAEERPEARARITREILASGRRARERAQGGEKISDEESLASRYVVAVEKMQGPTAR
jgi:hypothetical protein